MKRNVLVVVLAVAIASSLSGCGVALKLTHDKPDGGMETVTAVGTQAALFSHEKLMKKTWNAAAMACGQDDAQKAAWQKELEELEDAQKAATSAGGLNRPQMAGLDFLVEAFKATETALASAKGAADQGVGLLNLFGSDSYTITLSCNPTNQEGASSPSNP